MVVEKLPMVILPSGRVPGRVLLVLPILEAGRRRNRDEIAKKGPVLEGFGTRGIYMRRGATRGGAGAPGAPLARPGVGSRQVAAWAPWASAGAPLWYIFTPRPETLKDGTLFRDLVSVPPPPRFQDRERQENSSRHPAGGEDHHRELLHRHGRLPDES